MFHLLCKKLSSFICFFKPFYQLHKKIKLVFSA